MNNNSIYTEDELAILEKVKNVRISIIDEMTKDGPPDRSGDIRVLNEVLTSTDKMIADTASIRIKQEEASSNGAAVEMVVELLKQTRSNKQRYVEQGSIPELPQNLKNIDVVPGETELAAEELSPEDFIAPEFDPTQV